MTERKFTRGLNKPGMAAQLRENISQVVRESASLIRIGSTNVMAHRAQMKICKDASSWQRPNVLINQHESDKVTNDEPEVSAEQQKDGENERQELPRGSRKRKHPLSGNETFEPRRSKRKKKSSKSDDFYYSRF